MQTPSAVLSAISVISLLGLLALPGFASADDAQKNLQSETDTFGRLLEKQAQLLDSEMDAKIRSNQNQGLGVVSTGANPLASVKQDVSEQEPVVEAIWGLKGKEVAEVSYKGRRVPVSMQEPFISKVDGWKLESIGQYMIQLVRTDGHNVVQRKTILLNFLGGDNAQAHSAAAQSLPAVGSPLMPVTPSTPAINAPLMR